VPLKAPTGRRFNYNVNFSSIEREWTIKAIGWVDRIRLSFFCQDLLKQFSRETLPSMLQMRSQLDAEHLCAIVPKQRGRDIEVEVCESVLVNAVKTVSRIIESSHKGPLKFREIEELDPRTFLPQVQARQRPYTVESADSINNALTQALKWVESVDEVEFGERLSFEKEFDRMLADIDIPPSELSRPSIFITES
jgi:hypothetical protein